MASKGGTVHYCVLDTNQNKVPVHYYLLAITRFYKQSSHIGF